MMGNYHVLVLRGLGGSNAPWLPGVKNSPTGAVDPSGHMYIYPEDRPERMSPRMGAVIDPRVMIIAMYSYTASANIEPATALGNRKGPTGNVGGAAQYVSLDTQAYRDYNDGTTPIHYNLCGHLAFASTYESVYGGDALAMLWEKYDTAPGELSDLNTWVSTINNLPGWSASYKTPGFSPNTGTAFEEFAAILSRGDYVMILCTMDPRTGLLVTTGTKGGVPHWVAVKGVSPHGIVVYNPYTNDMQPYTWSYFNNTRSDAIIISYQPPDLPANAT